MIFKSQPRLSPEERALVLRAYKYAAEAHEGARRDGGEPYITHPVAVAQILADLRLDAPTLAAALLHDVVEDVEGIKIEDIEQHFGAEVAQLVDGVTKLGKLPTSTDAMRNGKAGDREAETLRKIFLSMNNDIRVVLIKLADRLHNMRTLGYVAPEKQIKKARETLDIFAPLANRLGIWQIKWELEDLSFRYLNPEKYREIASQLATRRAEREKYLETVKARLIKEISALGIPNVQVSARPKHIYSIYRKMERKRIPFDQVYDIHALRVIVPEKVQCYQVLGVVHSIWRPIPGEFDDYIAAPKNNFYQSLHTAVVDDQGKTIEVQIRTPEMHQHAEYGIAAHWRYKEGTAHDKAFEEHLRYLRHLIESAAEGVNAADAQEFVSVMRSDVFQNRVYVFTPKGDVIDLPSGATPIDFAYHIHTDIGHRCRGARVNGVQVSLDYRLKSGDRVEIITSSKRAGPSLDWLNPSLGYVQTSRARNKIKAWFKRVGRENNIALGRNVVDRELARLGLASKPREEVAALFGFAKVDDFFAAVGYGDISAPNIATKVLEADRKAQREAAAETLAPNTEAPQRPVNASDGIDIMGDTGMLITLGRCCNPVRGDPIVGYITRGKGVTVHRADCPNVINSSEPERFINVTWGSAVERAYPVPIVITAYDREGLLRDIGAVTANENINISELRVQTRNSVASIFLTIELENLEQLSRVLAKIEMLPNVIEARRRVNV
ncbi:MAG: (p)ppGpp synthetase [Candidatus Thermofonsia Clade 1 bacterium]|uniref:(P)ppGpp synthetase n=1 Tax=Candidatus Thermofonsia Clade 1 bacterium TaxID=2364210 RepID=A0A2M8PIH7_9CHLR|nr:MAG: (p)ppGpp synthetase [Candidatus Thermofonsia Clade 1 bacterium]RMF53977.1 MAG: bifunctional (p)ppGpp synthetase/guanosine-3',5'-bis(diphosphate) 3'-pyrophosphohydrolase [Chloroflexota bacterium]